MTDELDNLREEYEEKRAELIAALKEGRVRGPLLALPFIIPALISTGVSIGASLLTRALTPRQKQTVGDRGGQEFHIQRSEQGVFIPEIYGGDPGDGLGGGVKLAPIIVWLWRDSGGNAARKHTNTHRGGGGGKFGGPKQPDVTTVTYDIPGILLMWGRGPLTLKRMNALTDVIFQQATPTGVIDTDVLPDPDYTPDTLPSPNGFYTVPRDRVNGALTADGTGGYSGDVVVGNHAGIAFYEGNATQLPDPVVEAYIDAKYGAGSTPAYRHRAVTRLSDFYLTKYSEAFPPITALLEHKTLKTLDGICGHWCGRVGLSASDYSFTDLSTVNSRGIAIGGRYKPAELMDNDVGEFYNVFFSEPDGVITGRRYESLTSVVTISEDEIGWQGGDADAIQAFPSDFEDETRLPRRVDVRYTDPERDYGQNSQGYSRQITTGEQHSTVDVQITATADEAREVAQRKTYREYIKGTSHPFTLPWTYLWLNAGEVFTVLRRDGTTHLVQLTSIRGGVGTLECQGVAHDAAAYSQPVTTSAGEPFEPLPVPIPAMTLWGVYDGPLLRDEENTVNNGSGFYAWKLKRRGEGSSPASALYVDRGLDYEQIATFEKEAVAGVCVTALTATTSVHGIVADAVTVDLHDEDATLESYTEEDLWAGAGAAIFGDEVCQILSATREPDTVTFPNRWYVVVGLRARRGTDFAINDHVAGERFVLINDAIKFVPMNLNEKDVTRNYRMVTSGQSLDDAATIPFTWTGGSVKLLAPVQVERKDDDVGNQFWKWGTRKRMGHGLRSGWSGFEDRPVTRFEIDIFTDSTRAAKVSRAPIKVEVGEPLSAIFETTGGTKTSAVTSSTTTINAARSLLVIHETGNFVEATLALEAADANLRAVVGVIRPSADWRDNSLTTAVAEFEVSLGHSGGYTLSVNRFGVSVASVLTGVSASERIRIRFVEDKVEFYRVDVNASVPFYTSPVAPTFPYHAYARARGSGGTVGRVTDAKMTVNPVPAFTYLASQQSADGLTPGGTTYADIYPIDDRGGRGYPAEVTLINSA